MLETRLKQQQQSLGPCLYIFSLSKHICLYVKGFFYVIFFYVITANKKMLINNNSNSYGNIERLSTYHYEAVRDNKGLRDGTKI